MSVTDCTATFGKVIKGSAKTSKNLKIGTPTKSASSGDVTLTPPTVEQKKMLSKEFDKLPSYIRKHADLSKPLNLTVAKTSKEIGSVAQFKVRENLIALTPEYANKPSSYKHELTHFALKDKRSELVRITNEIERRDLPFIKFSTFYSPQVTGETEKLMRGWEEAAQIFENYDPDKSKWVGNVVKSYPESKSMVTFAFSKTTESEIRNKIDVIEEILK